VARREKKQALKKLTRQIDKKGNCGKDRKVHELRSD
jgi:hypothetical protein